MEPETWVKAKWENLEVMDPFLIPKWRAAALQGIAATCTGIWVWTLTSILHRELFKKTKHLRTILSYSSALKGKQQLQKYTKPLIIKVF